MKKLLILSTVFLTLFACSKEDQVSAVKASRQDGKTAKFYASSEVLDSGTKVYADEDLRVLWNERDMISIFNYTNVNDGYVFDGEDGDNSGGFSFEIEGPNPSTHLDLRHIYAVYPYLHETFLLKGESIDTLSVDLPRDQYYREKSFGVGANTMVAVADGNFLGFKNVCGYLRFRFYGDNMTVKYIMLEGNNGEKIAGRAKVILSTSAAPSVSMQSEATDRVFIYCPEGVELGTTSADATEFIFVIPPTVFSGGFTVRVYTINNESFESFEKSSTRSLTISRNRMESMGVMKLERFIPFIPVNWVELDQTSATLKVGDTVTLTATVSPADATDKTVTWSTSDATVATVVDGVVTAKKIGSATITAMAGDKEATCFITVEATPTPVTSVTLSQTSATLEVGNTMTLTATVNPADATDKTVTWSTSDATVATVVNGEVTAKKIGTATITAMAGDKEATCSITVVIPVNSITLNQTSATLKVGETVTLTATVNPDDATDKTVTWSTSNATVATVVDGVVTARKIGAATITAMAGGKEATCVITVVPSGSHEGFIEEDW